jgi:hypothetical protein
MFRLPSRSGYSLLAGVALLGLTVAARAQEPPELFRPVSPASAFSVRGLSVGPLVVRQRLVRLNTETLGLGDSAALPNDVAFNLFPDALYRFTRVGPVRRLRSGNRVWEARLPGSELAHAVLVVGEHGVRGNISDGAGRYFKILPHSGDVHELREVSGELVYHRDDVLVPLQQPQSQIAAGLERMISGPADADESPPVYLDILVAYSPAARQRVGSAAAMQILADATFAEMNVGLVNSNINARVRAVAVVEVALPGGEAASGAFLNQVTGLASLEALRNQYGADLVTVWIDGPAAGGGTVGIAWIMQTVSPFFAPSAYSIVEVNWVDGPSFSFSHEIGHNLGAAHDRDNASVNGAFSYSYGYQQDAQVPRFYTLMAYSNGCSGCSRINYWSNPNALFGGLPTGIASGSDSADNARTLNQSTPVASDWRQEVTPAQTPSTTGVFRPSNGGLFLKSHNTAGFADRLLTFGLPGDKPVAGDWNGDGIDTIGVFRNGVFYLRNSNTNGFADLTFGYGTPTDLPIVGDWDGDGVDTIGVFRDGLFILRNSNSTGPAEAVFALGVTGDIPISGDWDGDGIDTVGIFRPSNGALYLKNQNSTGFADVVLTFGLPGDKPVTGDWDGNGTDTIGVFRNGTFMLRNSNTNGFAQIVFGLGVAGDDPISGVWGLGLSP